MNTFQYLALTFLALLVLAEGYRLWRSGRRGVLFRLAVWLLAAAAIARPELTQELATVIGITRGADLVFYLFVLAFLLTSFYFYARCVHLERQLTEVVRHLAIREARRDRTVS